MEKEERKLIAIDLFCGAGGMSAGFRDAGFDIIWANDSEKTFCQTYSVNHMKTRVVHGDIRKITTEEIKRDIGNKKVNIVFGGPPCQGFSHAGRRDPKDPRNSLFMDFVRVVEGLQPEFFVMENVPGILTMKTQEGENVVDIILREFDKIGYRVHPPKKLLAADYGVPQKRRRVFFIGTKTDKEIKFPEPTHTKEINNSFTKRKSLRKFFSWSKND